MFLNRLHTMCEACFSYEQTNVRAYVHIYNNVPYSDTNMFEICTKFRI